MSDSSSEDGEPVTLNALAAKLSPVLPSPAEKAKAERTKAQPKIVKTCLMRVVVTRDTILLLEVSLLRSRRLTVVNDAQQLVSLDLSDDASCFALIESETAEPRLVVCDGRRTQKLTLIGDSRDEALQWCAALRQVGVQSVDGDIEADSSIGNAMTQMSSGARKSAGAVDGDASLQVEGAADTFDPTRTIQSVESVVVNSSKGFVSSSTVTTTTTSVHVEQDGTKVTTVETSTSETRKPTLSSSLIALPEVSESDRAMVRRAVNLPSASKSGWLCKLSSNQLRQSLQKRWCAVVGAALVYGEFGKVDGNVESKAGESVSSAFVAKQKLKSATSKRFKSFKARLKGSSKSDKHAAAEAEAAAASKRKVMFFQKGRLDLGECLLQSIDDERLRGRGAFGVAVAGRTYVFCPLRADERSAWLDALRSAGTVDATSMRMPAAANAKLTPPKPLAARAPPAAPRPSSPAKKPADTPQRKKSERGGETASEARGFLVEQRAMAVRYNDRSEHHGFLLKMGSSLVSQPHNRWFSMQQLSEDNVRLAWGTFWATAGGPVEFSVRGQTPLSEATLFRVPRAAAPNHRAHCFALNSDTLDRSLICFAQSEPELRAWLAALVRGGAKRQPSHYERLQKFTESTMVKAIESSSGEKDDATQQWSEQTRWIDPLKKHAALLEKFNRTIGTNVQLIQSNDIADSDRIFFD